MANAGMTFDTELSPEEEDRFKIWKQRHAPKDSGQDYDLRGAFKAGLTPDPTTGHWPDTFKKPNHPTFSDQSRYAKYGNPGTWQGETFVPPKPKWREDYDQLDPAHKNAVDATIRRLQSLHPPLPEEPIKPYSEPIGSKLRRYGMRGLEALGEYGKAFSQPFTAMAKTPANLQEAVGIKPNRWTSALRTGARTLESELQKGVRFMGEEAGTPLEEMKTREFPVVGSLSAATPFRAAGLAVTPGPALKGIPKLFTPKAIKPAAEGMAKMGAYGGALQTAEELDKPKEEQDWMNVPKAAATMALGAPPLQRVMGFFQPKPGGLPPPPRETPGQAPREPGPAPSSSPVVIPKELPLDMGGEPEPFRPLEPPPRPHDLFAQEEIKPSPIQTQAPPEISRPRATVEELPPPPVPQGRAPGVLRGTPPEEPFSLAPQPMPRLKAPKPEQLGIEVPPPTIGERPLIGREAQLEEAPLFSKESQTPAPIQTEIGTLEMVSTPRNELPAEHSDEMLRRAEKAAADLDIAAQGKAGFSHEFDLGPGQGEKTTWGSANADWYKEVTNIPKGELKTAGSSRNLKPGEVASAVQRIIEDKGKDTGPVVEQVKYALLHDREFEHSPWGQPVEHSTPETPLPQVERNVGHDVAQDAEAYNRTANLLNNERGSVALSLGEGMGPLQYVVTARRVAELHPKDFKPVYDQAQQRQEFATSQKYDLMKALEPFERLEPAQRERLSELLSQRRRLQRPVLMPPELQGAQQSVDTAMGMAERLVNDVRETQGLPPINHEDFFVPFTRSGDYLVVMEGPKGQVPRWVTAAQTLREAKQIAKELQAAHPQGSINIKPASGTRGSQPHLDFATMGMLRNAGLLGPDEFEAAIKQFDMPMGFSSHFQKALKTFGEAKDLTDPIHRYVDALTNYSARALYDQPMKEAIGKIKDVQVRQYAEKYHKYLNEKPVEYSRIRGLTAVWDLAMNVGSIVQNASQVPLLGLPNLQRAVGSLPKAMRMLKDGTADLLHPEKPVRIGTVTYKPKDVIERFTRSGDVRPVNAEELFGTMPDESAGIELGSPFVQRLGTRGTLPPRVASGLSKGLDVAAGGLETGIQKLGMANRVLGRKISYGVSRLTGKTADVAADKARNAHGMLMQGFGWIEEKNRTISLLSGYRAGLEKGMSEGEAFEFARTYSRDTNFDYSPSSRAQAFRGMGAPLGLFMTYQTEAMSTYRKLIMEQMRKPGLRKLGGAATTALAAFWTLGGLKGMPFVEDLDTYGQKAGLPAGMMSKNLPDWLYHGPASAATGLDIASKFKLGPRSPLTMGESGLEFDPSQIAVAQPWFNTSKAVAHFAGGPMDASEMQKLAEGMAPPALRAPMVAARWAGMGPAGSLEQGTVGTIKGHTPGPTESGKREFFQPSAKDIAGKALTYTPLKLSKQYSRGRLEGVSTAMEKQQTTALVNTVAHELQRNGTAIRSENMKKLAKEHPQTYRELAKAYEQWRSGTKGSVEEIYRRAQEPKPKKQMVAP